MTDDQLAVIWSTPPADNELWLWRDTFSSDFARFWTHELRLSARFVAATSAASGVIDMTTVPGFPGAWRPDPGLAVSRGILYGSPGETEWTTSGVVDDLPEAQSSRVAAPRGSIAQFIARGRCHPAPHRRGQRAVVR